MTDQSPPPSPLALAAASFLTQALELSEEPATIVPELTTIKEELNVAIYSVELDSSIGNAAFLVYVYALQDSDEDGMSGADLYQAGLTTLRQAAARDTPGPRLVAHADTDTVGFILATTPATWRRLQGEEPSLIATEADLPQTEMSTEQRASVAEDLHRALKEANDHARTWLAAIRAAGKNATEDDLAFTEAETALALFVLDNANVSPLLNALNVLVTSAQEQAGRMITTNQARSVPDAD